MDAKQQVKPEVRTAIGDGLKKFRNNPSGLESKIKARYNTPDKMTTEDVRKAVEILDDNREEVVEFAAEEIAKQVDREEKTGSVTMDDASQEGSKTVAATDGGSLFSDSARDTFYVAMIAWNAFFLGLNAPDKKILATLSLFALVFFISAHTLSHYNIDIQPD